MKPVREDVPRVGDRGDRVRGTGRCFRRILLERAGRPPQHEVGGEAEQR